MLARRLLLSLSLEIGLYVGLAVFISVPPGWLPGLIPLGVVSLRLYLLLLTFAIAGLFASPRPRLSLAGWVRLIMSEYWALLRCCLWYLPLSRWLARPQAGPWPSKHLPVVLVHGFLCNAGYWRELQDDLAARGVRSYTLSLTPVYGDIDAYAQQLAERVEQVLADTAAPRVVLVGHSMGGLVARAYLRDPRRASRVARLLTLGSPHSGSLLAWLARGINASQMRPGNDWLASLEENPPRVALISLYSLHDNIVIPQRSSELVGADNQTISAVGHLSLGLSAGLFAQIYALITGESAASLRAV